MSWRLEVDPSAERELWLASGAAELTGYADGPPGHGPGAPASVVAAALATLAAAHPAAELPGVELLGERAVLAGLARNAPWSCGGAFRVLAAADGWVGLSLPRESDLELLPALVEGAVGDPWGAVGTWLEATPAERAQDRIVLLGLPGAVIHPNPPPPRRDFAVVSHGGSRPTADGPPLIVDLTALWAGPLCARLLGCTGARVVKVESTTRPDGARRGPAAFYDLLHSYPARDGEAEPVPHESIALDFDTSAGRAELADLINTADVVLESSRPRALQQLGIRAEAAVAAGTIWLSITAYGRRGPDARRIGFGDDVAAGAGLVAWGPDGPYPVGDALADPLTGVVAAAAVIDALRRDVGAMIELSMHDLAAWVASLPV